MINHQLAHLQTHDTRKGTLTEYYHIVLVQSFTNMHHTRYTPIHVPSH
jgi:DNA polymerase sigma